MARVRKYQGRAEEEVKPIRKGIKPPYRTSKPGANPYVIYVHYTREDDDIGKVLVLSFGELYSAHYFVNLLLDGDGYKWVDPIGSRECIQTDFGLRISMFNKDLQNIIDYEPTEAEVEWKDRQVVQRVMQFKYGKVEREQPSEVNTGSDDTPRKRTPKTEREPKVKKEPKPKIDKTGLVTANDIAKELGVEGRDVRGVLRAMKLEKPDGGWAFDKKTAEEIREKVKKGLKEKAKKK